MKTRELPGIRETTEDFDGIEAQILKIFREEIYFPLLRELKRPKRDLENARPDALVSALESGRLRFSHGTFFGKLDAELTKALRKAGAEWDAAKGVFRLQARDLPPAVQAAVATSETRFWRALSAVDKKLTEVLPEQLSERVKIAHYFDRTLYRIDQKFEAQVSGISFVPKLTPETRAKVAAGYTKDLQRYINDFTQKQVLELRKEIAARAERGDRYEGVVGAIKDSYGVSERKARFLARQETALMMASFKKARYQEAGIKQYRWQCVVGSPAHPVRPMHAALNGKVYSFDHPPITDDKDNRNNPGEDYNCRCIARPIVRF